MKGRLENKIKTENHIQNKIADMPEYMQRFYYSIKNKTHATKLRYMDNVIRFLKAYNKSDKLPTKEELKNIDSYAIQVYMTDIGYYERDGELRELKESTQCNIYSSLSAFFRFLQREGYSSNPFSEGRIERPKVKENDVVYLTPEEVRLVEKQILDGAGNDLSKRKQKDWKHRDLLLFRIPVINGLRVTALSEINVEDIDMENRKILVTEKGAITKKVDFDIKTYNYLRVWLRERERLLDGKKESALFISNRRTRMVQRSIEKLINKYTVECIHDKHITPHKLRATFGTNSYQQTGDIYLTASLLGHKTTAPTRRYVSVDQKAKTDVVNMIGNLY